MGVGALPTLLGKKQPRQRKLPPYLFLPRPPMMDGEKSARLKDGVTHLRTPRTITALNQDAIPSITDEEETDATTLDHETRTLPARPNLPSICSPNTEDEGLALAEDADAGTMKRPVTDTETTTEALNLPRMNLGTRIAIVQRLPKDEDTGNHPPTATATTTATVLLKTIGSPSTTDVTGRFLAFILRQSKLLVTLDSTTSTSLALQKPLLSHINPFLLYLSNLPYPRCRSLLRSFPLGPHKPHLLFLP